MLITPRLLNLAVGTALISLWLLPYFRIQRTIVELFGLTLHYLVTFVGLLGVWLTVLSCCFFRNALLSSKSAATVLLAGNGLSIVFLLLHTYNDLFFVVGTTVEEIMNESATELAEAYLRAVFPLAKLLVLLGVLMHVLFIFKSSRSNSEIGRGKAENSGPT